MSNVHEEVVSSWSQYLELVDGPTFRSWAFRGQADAQWGLWTALSRYLRATGVHPKWWPEQEQRILRIFQRKAHLFLQHVPDPDDVLQWLALMQHHGAPTRVLDLTWSPYVAAFFALELATTDAAVWAFNVVNISVREEHHIRNGQAVRPHDIGLRRDVKAAPSNYAKYFLPNQLPFVYIGEPYIMNQRLIAQSGTFAVPGKIDEPLEAILGDYPDPDNTVIKLRLASSKMRREAMRAFYAMNITNATLFPGLDGLARSTAYELEHHWAFDPYTPEIYRGFEQ